VSLLITGVVSSVLGHVWGQLIGQCPEERASGVRSSVLLHHFALVISAKCERSENWRRS